MVDLRIVLLGLAALLAVIGVYASWRSLRARADFNRSSEGMLLGVEFGAFSLPHAQLPEAAGHRRARQWSALAAMTLVAAVAAGGLSLTL